MAAAKPQGWLASLRSVFEKSPMLEQDEPAAPQHEPAAPQPPAPTSLRGRVARMQGAAAPVLPASETKVVEEWATRTATTATPAPGKAKFARLRLFFDKGASSMLEEDGDD